MKSIYHDTRTPNQKSLPRGKMLLGNPSFNVLKYTHTDSLCAYIPKQIFPKRKRGKGNVFLANNQLLSTLKYPY